MKMKMLNQTEEKRLDNSVEQNGNVTLKEVDGGSGQASQSSKTLYFGLGDQHPMTLEEIGETFDLTRERVRQIKEKAIRRLKHTSRSKILKTYLG